MDKGRGIVLRGPLCSSSRCLSAGPPSAPAASVLDSQFSFVGLGFGLSDRIPVERDNIGLVNHAV